MIIYNVTINIDYSEHHAWLQWMKQEHIPDVLNCGVFTEARMVKVIVDEEQGGETYSVQYTCGTMADYERYVDNFAKAMQAKAAEKFGGKFVAFRTLLQTIDL
ncbi:MAG: DUF4286 family protein [Bacteroidetes bacterium]|nr:DUF4286 family protein [Bacteroidota bacterium]